MKVVDGVDVHDFCTYSTTYTQTYPFTMVAEQEEASLVDRECGKRFYTKRHDHLLTLHFVHMRAALNQVGLQHNFYDYFLCETSIVLCH